MIQSVKTYYSSNCIPGCCGDVEIIFDGTDVTHIMDGNESSGKLKSPMPKISRYEHGSFEDAVLLCVRSGILLEETFDGRTAEEGASEIIDEWSVLKLYFENGMEGLLLLPPNPEVINVFYIENGKVTSGETCELEG